jgi:lysophospholipase L1-like esterase
MYKPTDAQAEEYIGAWLDDHPEATTTVEDGAVTTAKLADGAVTDAKLAQTGGVLEEVADLKSAIYQNVALTFTDNKFVDNNGAEYSSELWALSNQIPVVAGYRLKIRTEIQGTASICVYNTNNMCIQSIQGTAGVKNYDIIVPTGGNYVKFSCYKANKANAFVQPFALADSVIEALNQSSTSVVITVASDDVIANSLITKTGYVADSAAWDCTGYIKVPQLETIYVNAYIYGTGAVVFYDENKNVLFGIDGNNAESYGAHNYYTRTQIVKIEDASNIRYVRFCSQRQYVNVTACYVSYNAQWNQYANQLINAEKTETYKNKNVLVIGDSISSDAYGSYKKWVTDLIEEGKLSAANTTNSSQHATGFVARYSTQTPDDFITRMEAIADKSSYDLVIVFGGINDYIQNVPLGESGQDKTVYFKPAVDYFFDYLINNFTQARICVLLPLRTYNIYPNTAGNKQEVYAQYIHDVAKTYCLPVLNLTEESGFCPFNDTFKQMWTLIPSGYTAPDGTHPNADYEKTYLAPMIWKFISGLID